MATATCFLLKTDWLALKKPGKPSSEHRTARWKASNQEAFHAISQSLYGASSSALKSVVGDSTASGCSEGIAIKRQLRQGREESHRQEILLVFDLQNRAQAQATFTSLLGEGARTGPALQVLSRRWQSLCNEGSHRTLAARLCNHHKDLL